MDRRTMLANLGLAALGSVVAPSALAGGLAAKPLEGPRAGYFPDVTLYTQDNKPVRFYTDLVHGKVVTFNFMYTSCNAICPRMTANLVKVQEGLGDLVGRDVFMYSFSIDPETDTPSVLKKYTQEHKIKPGWLFLTGKPADIQLLRKRLGFVDPDPKVDSDIEQHTGMLRYGNETLDRWGACPALSTPQYLIESILWMLPKRELPKQKLPEQKKS